MFRYSVCLVSRIVCFHQRCRQHDVYDKFNDLISFVREGDLRMGVRKGQMKWNIFLAKILYIYRQREGHSQRAER